MMKKGATTPKPYEDLDDGASEVVDHRARRRVRTAPDLGKIVDSRIGGEVTQGMEAAKDEFIAFRRPSGAAKVQLDHLEILAVLWRLWASRRAANEEPGISVTEISKGHTKPISALRAILNTLMKSGLIRSVRTSVGWASNRASYYPTDLGIQMLATAQTFGPGTSIQIGRTPTAWKARSDDAPHNLFQHAAFLKNRKG